MAGVIATHDTIGGTSGAQAATAGGSVGDYFALLKPRVMSLVIFTALVGLVCAPGHIHPVIGFTAILCIAVGAGASGALNMWYDADIDARMARTAGRPIPQGRVSPQEALTFGMVLGSGSVLVLGLLVNWVAAALLGFTIAFYVLVYTMWLKRRTAQNIVIGGAAGAFPPIVGWASVTGGIGLESVLLFLVIFLWTPPHFWALALYRSADYARVGVPMLPVVAGTDETRRQIWLYSLALVVSSVLPTLFGGAGWASFAAALVLGALLLKSAQRVRTAADGTDTDKAAKVLFLYSILYLFALFAVILVERLVIGWLARGWLA